MLLQHSAAFLAYEIRQKFICYDKHINLIFIKLKLIAYSLEKINNILEYILPFNNAKAYHTDVKMVSQPVSYISNSNSVVSLLEKHFYKSI